VLDDTIIDRNMQCHWHQAFIGFLNTIEMQVPKRKPIHAILDSYAIHKHPQGATMARPSSTLDVPFHTDQRLLAQCRGRLLRKVRQAPP
jgi:hypothetical protein